jgi:DNA-binding response OmpR family regulator
VSLSYPAASGSPESRPLPRRLRVLVVDDEPDTVLSLLALLRAEGYEAKGANDGRAALRELATFDPDAVVMDIAMPHMSGWDVAREVRKVRGPKRVLIAITGTFVSAPDEILSRTVGFNHYLLKPCDPGALLKILGAVVPR